ncbi:hypothetical protein Tco_1161522, partial [Tanacetum coccineum]
IIMANLPPNHNEFAPAAEAAPDNMNGWVEEEDPEMEEEEEDPEMEEEEEEMEMNADEEYHGPVLLILNLRLLPSNPEDPTPSHIRSDLDALHRRVRQIKNDDVRAENKRLKMMLDCSEFRTRDAWRELDRATWHYHHLRRWSITVENLLPPRLQYQEPPYALPEALLAPVIHNDPRDPYIAARDAATAPATDNDDSPTQKETSPSEPQGSPPRDS